MLNILSDYVFLSFYILYYYKILPLYYTMLYYYYYLYFFIFLFYIVVFIVVEIYCILFKESEMEVSKGPKIYTIYFKYSVTAAKNVKIKVD